MPGQRRVGVRRFPVEVSPSLKAERTVVETDPIGCPRGERKGRDVKGVAVFIKLAQHVVLYKCSSNGPSNRRSASQECARRPAGVGIDTPIDLSLVSSIGYFYVPKMHAPKGHSRTHAEILSLDPLSHFVAVYLVGRAVVIDNLAVRAQRSKDRENARHHDSETGGPEIGSDKRSFHK